MVTTADVQGVSSANVMPAFSVHYLYFHSLLVLPWCICDIHVVHWLFTAENFKSLKVPYKMAPGVLE